MSVAVLAALRVEGHCLRLGPRRPGGGARLHLGGAGPVAARRAAIAALRDGADALLSWGFAAGLDPRLPAGTLVIADELVDEAGARLTPDAAWSGWLLEQISARVDPRAAALAETSIPLLDSAQKSALRDRTGAAVADMESVAIARVARDAGVAFAALRAVSDAADRTVPVAALAALGPGGSLDLRALGAATLRHPRDMLALVRLAPAFAAARRALREAGAALAEGLGPP
ncbi:MAG: hypothetical protein ACOZDY_05665 [Pseudomonadota bacterium]